MDVGLLVLGALVVDDVGDVLDIDAAGGHIGRHQDVDVAMPEGAQRLLSGALSEVSVDGGGGEAALDQLVRHSGRRSLRAGEDQHEPPVAGLQHAREQLDLVEGVRAVDELLDRLDRVGVLGLVAHRADVRRLGHVAPRQGDDRAGHGRREKHRLAAGRGERHEGLDVGQEAQVEHLVGLVEHDDPGLRQVEVPLLGQVDEAARRADDDLDASLEGLDLRLVGAAAVDREHPDTALLACALEVTGDLDGQLTGRSDGQRLRLARLGQVGPPLVSRRDDPLDHRDAEAEGLAGAGLGLADDVVPAEGDRQRHGLDGEGVDDPEVAQRGDDVGVDAEVGEGGLGFLRHQRSHAKMSLPIGPRSRRAQGVRPIRREGPIGGLRGRSPSHSAVSIRADRAPWSTQV